MMRPSARVRGWFARCLPVVAIGAAGAATVTLGSPAVLAAGSNRPPASTLLKDACSATLAAPAFNAQGHLTLSGTKLSFDVYFGSNGELITLTQHGNQTMRAIIDGPSTYVNGNRAFWQSATNSRSAATVLAGRWIDMTSDKKDSTGLTKDVSKGNIMSQCGQGGSAAYAGSAVVNGVKVTKVHQNARTETDTYFIEVHPTPYILRVVGSPKNKDSGDLVLSHYGVQPNTAAPTGAIPISQLSGSNSGSSGNSGNSGNSGGARSNLVASCKADFRSLEVAVEAYHATVGSYPKPPAAWSASTYASNFAPLVSSHGHGGSYMHSALDPTDYVIEFDANGHVWIEPAGTYDTTYNPAHAASDTRCESVAG